LAERYAAAIGRSAQGEQKRRNQDLPDVIEITIGMKVMVTENVETDLDIMLSPDEPVVSDLHATIKLQQLPVCILLEGSTIPVEPATRSYRIKCTSPEGKAITHTVKRRQFPMTATYAFTDYRSQGQTIPTVLVDIATPPTGRLNLFNLYVALSQSSGRSTIRLLRDFNNQLFQAAHKPELLAEDDRLEELNAKTMTWWKDMGWDTRTP